MSEVEILGDKVWCPRCQAHSELCALRKAANVVDVDKRTVYRYIDQGLVFAVKVAGRTNRACLGCLFRGEPEVGRDITLKGTSPWCSKCKGATRLLSIRRASKIAAVSERTIYRYIEEGFISSVKICGRTIRVCAGCLLKRSEEPDQKSDRVKKV